jgi:hypothetical protein
MAQLLAKRFRRAILLQALEHEEEDDDVEQPGELQH